MARKTVTVGSGNPTTTSTIDLPGFIKKLTASTDPSRMSKVTKMLRAERFQLFSSVTDEHVTGVVKSQTDSDLVYACRLDKDGRVLLLHAEPQPLRRAARRAVQAPARARDRARRNRASSIRRSRMRGRRASRKKKPALDKDAATATFVRYKGAEAGEVDWRPTETIPEDYYAL